MRILFVDDDPANVALVAATLKDALGAEIKIATSVEEAIAVLHHERIDLVVTDVFIPRGDDARRAMGPRARRAAELVEHLGGLVVLDELERLQPSPAVLVHTACQDAPLLAIIGERQRVRKPAPAEALLEAVLGVLRPSTWG